MPLSTALLIKYYIWSLPNPPVVFLQTGSLMRFSSLNSIQCFRMTICLQGKLVSLNLVVGGD